ncbi:lysosomal alpha-glucosidase-like [Dermacentor albipictus]|uniref:lysosomal alpha-glucosidase-like n=1 Tax=Dermacentor albipictus TaxID=60249 RepID=UPI0031FE09C5
MLLRLMPLLLSVACCQAENFSSNAFGNSSQERNFTGYKEQCRLASVVDRFDCYPGNVASEEDCEARGCCWGTLGDASPDGEPTIPNCYYPADYQGYVLDGLNHFPDRISAKLRRKIPSGIDKDVQSVAVNIVFYENDTARITILDATQTRFRPPVPQIPERKYTGSRLYNVSLSKDGQLRVYRFDRHSTTIFHTNLSRLVFTDQFLQLSTLLPSDYVYGLGEQWTTLRRNVSWTRRFVFNRDRPPKPGKNTYGTHPILLGVDNDRQGYGVFLHNSNALEVVLQPTPAVTFRALGGVLDLFVFAGPTAANVVSQLQHVVGMPAMPPYWGLGFHLCRFGYNSLNRTRYIMEMNIKAGIPLDTQWSDIDYMISRNDFTYDKDRFRGLPEFVSELHASGRHYVMIVDPAVSGSEAPGSYPPYDDGVAMDIFVKNITGGIVYGKVWNNKSSVFPDFSHPNATAYWMKQFTRFHDEVPFDGAWIDMNEPSNFYDGHQDGCPPNQKEDQPPYVPGGEKLCALTLCMSDRHYISSHYNVHNIYSQLEARATYKALVQIRRKRPFIISRATSPGQSVWSGLWSGDISSSWEDMKLSIPNMLSFSMYGMPLMGADICGFNKDATVELCARWHALGAFYPFSRNHNSHDVIDQDPFSLGKTVIEAASKNLRIRYMLIPYLYTLFYRSHVYGETVARPLFFEFPNDPKTYDIDEQFMWGSAFLFSPALYQNQTQVKAYVPASLWYDLLSGIGVKVESGTHLTFPAALSDPMNILIRGGHIFAGATNATTTKDQRQKPLFLFAALDKDGTAKGELFWDDGDSLDTIEKGKYNLFTFSANWAQKVVTLVTPVMSGYDEKPVVKTVYVAGVSQLPNDVTIGTRSLQFFYSKGKVLVISDVNQRLDQAFEITWS